MRLSRWLVPGALLLLGVGRAAAQDSYPEDSLGARIWLDRGDDAVLNRGDRVRIYYRTSADAYVAIFHIDTDGSVQLLYPQAPDIDHFTQGNKDYQLLFSRSAFWYVDEYPGTGYYFIVASQEPFDFANFTYSSYERGWDLSRVGRTVYRDPYLAMDDYVAQLIPDWKTAPYALDFLTYYVGEEEPYPRFLCYSCHEFRSYTEWNPYAYACSTFRVVIWDDPYFSPAYRYNGARVVFSRAVPGRARFEFKERAAGEAWSPIVRRRSAPTRHPVQFSEPVVAPRPTVRQPATRRSTPGSVIGPLRRESTPGQGQSGAGRQPERGATSREGRPSTIIRPPTTQGRAEPQRGQAVPVNPGTARGDRPVLERRPGTGTTTPTRPSDRAKPTERRGGSSGGATITRPGGSGDVRTVPRRGGGGSTSSARPSTQPNRPVVGGSRTRGGGASAQPPTRGSGGSVTRPSTRGRATVQPPTRRSGGSGGRPAAATRSRSSGSAGSARPRRVVVPRRGGRRGGGGS